MIIPGDLNSCLPRSHEKLTGRWCVHVHADNHGGGKLVLDLMKKHRLVAASTIHKPRRNHTNATFIQRDTRYKPLQLDYILCSTRWVSSVRSSRVRWGVSLQRWGRFYDHGLVECSWKAHLTALQRTARPDFSALINDAGVAKNFDEEVQRVLQSELTDPECPAERLCRLRSAT